MKTLLIVALALGAAIAGATVSQPAAATAEGCYMIRSTADARNQNNARDRAKRNLQSYIGRRLNTFTGKTISPISTTCIRNACEATAIVCPA
jgi:hypothetical protein